MVQGITSTNNNLFPMEEAYMEKEVSELRDFTNTEIPSDRVHEADDSIGLWNQWGLSSFEIAKKEEASKPIIFHAMGVMEDRLAT